MTVDRGFQERNIVLGSKTDLSKGVTISDDRPVQYSGPEEEPVLVYGKESEGTSIYVDTQTQDRQSLTFTTQGR